MEGVHHFARDSARTPMQWDDSENAGVTTGTPWLPVYDDYATYNVAAEMNDPDSILNWYIKLSKIRGEHEELSEGSYEELFHDDEQIFAFTRTSEAGKATVLVNFSTEEAQYDAACVENAELLLGSNGESVKGTLAPLEAVVYEEVG